VTSDTCSTRWPAGSCRRQVGLRIGRAGPRRPGRASSAATRNQILLLQRATPGEIERAVSLVGAATGRELRADSFSDLSAAIVYLAGFPEVHDGRLGGLVRKVVEWHRERRRRIAQRCLGGLGLELGTDLALVPAAPPPWQLPDQPGLRFLGTVGDIVAEGERMRHCIADLAPEALAGNVFLFHAEFDGSHASLAITPDGRVREAAGPRNRFSRAMELGRRALESWWASVTGAVPALPGRGVRP
jgi:hypothetical protein